MKEKEDTDGNYWAVCLKQTDTIYSEKLNTTKMLCCPRYNYKEKVKENLREQTCPGLLGTMVPMVSSKIPWTFAFQ